MNRKLLLKAHNAKLKVGILGGSFNPPHQGHVDLSNDLLNRLGFDYIVWLVAKQNPLKTLKTNSSFHDRILKAAKLNHNPRIIISDYESATSDRFTVNILRQIKRYNHHHLKLYWIMGADNITSFHKWKNWRSIPEIVPIVIVDRDHNIIRKVSSRLNTCLKFIPVINSASKCSVNKKKAVFLRIRKNPISSTKLRKKYEQESD